MAITFGKSTQTSANPNAADYRDSGMGYWYIPGEDGSTGAVTYQDPNIAPPATKYGLLSDMFGDDNKTYNPQNLADLLTGVANRAGVPDYDFGNVIQSLQNSNIWGKAQDNWYLYNSPTTIARSLLDATGDPRLVGQQFTPQENSWSNGVSQAQDAQFTDSRTENQDMKLAEMAVLAGIGAGGGAAFGLFGGAAGAGAGESSGLTGLADEFLGQSYAGLGSYGAGAAGGAGASEGLDAIGQMVTQIPDGMTATSYAASQGFPSADAWLSSLGGGAGAAAGASTTGLSGSAPADVAAGTGPGADTAYGTLGGGADASTAYGTLGAAGATGGTATTAASALSKVLNGTATASDWAQLAGQALPGVLGAVGANQQSDKLSDLANQYMGFGAPSRSRYEASMSPGFDPYTSIAGYKSAVDDASNSQMRALSTQGNPFGNPGGLIEAQKKVVAGTALPATQNYQNQNAAAGGLSQLAGAAPGIAQQSIGSGSGAYSALGSAAANVLNPQQQNPFAALGAGTMADWIKSMASSSKTGLA